MDNLAVGPVTVCSTKAGMAAGTTSTLTTASTQLFSLKGKAFSKAGTSNEATPTTDAATGAAFVAVAANKGSVYTICRDSAGALKVVQGTITDLTSQGTFIVAPQFGPVPDTLCPIGYIVVKVAAGGAAWTFGTSNLTGPPANTTITYVDCFTMPERPQVA